MNRHSEIIFFVGKNNVGKSAMARKMVLGIYDKYADIVAFDPQKRFEDIADYNVETYEDMYAFQEFKDTLFIFDDYRLLHSSDKLERGGWLEKLMYYRAEYRNDFIFICHFPNEIIHFLSGYVDYYYVFASNSLEEDIKKKIQNWRIFSKAVKEINLYTEVHGIGKYPIFPHIFVDTNKNTITKINMNKNV